MEKLTDWEIDELETDIKELLGKFKNKKIETIEHISEWEGESDFSVDFRWWSETMRNKKIIVRDNIIKDSWTEEDEKATENEEEPYKEYYELDCVEDIIDLLGKVALLYHDIKTYKDDRVIGLEKIRTIIDEIL